MNHKVAVRYASSLIESSAEKNTLESVSRDVDFVYNTICGSDELKRILSNPVIKTESKTAILTEIFKDKITAGLLEFLNFVVRKGREEELVNILEMFTEIHDERMGIVNIAVSTAFPLTSDQEEKLRKKFEDRLGKKIRFKIKIDKDTIGGFVAKVKDTVYDASVKHQLELLRKEFLRGGGPLN